MWYHAPRLVFSILLFLATTTTASPSSCNSKSTRLSDRWGYPVTATNNEAVDAYTQAVLNYARLNGEVVSYLNQAIELDDQFILPHLYLGFILLLSTGVTHENELVQKSFRRAMELSEKLVRRQIGIWNDINIRQTFSSHRKMLLSMAGAHKKGGSVPEVIPTSLGG